MQGSAKIIGSNLVEIENSTFQAKTILISTGSMPSEIKNIEVDEKNIVTSTGALNFTGSSKKTCCYRRWIHWTGTLGSVWKRLGSEVTVIEFSPSIVPTMDVDTAEIFFKTLKNQGLNFFT